MTGSTGYILPPFTISAMDSLINRAYHAVVEIGTGSNDSSFSPHGGILPTGTVQK